MSWRQHECPGCGEPQRTWWDALIHCDPIAYIDTDTDTDQ